MNVPIAAQPAAFRTTDECHSFTRLPEFPDDLETIQISRQRFVEFGKAARAKASGTSAAAAAATRRTSARSRQGRRSRRSVRAEVDRLHAQRSATYEGSHAIGIDVGGTKCAAGLVAS